MIPKSKLGYRSHNTPAVPESIRQTYHEQVLALLNAFVPLEPVSPITRTVLTLSPEAQAAWRDYQAEIEIQLRPGEKFELHSGWAGKMPGFALRLAGLLHIAEYGAAPLLITPSTLQNALAIARALGEHALAAFGLMGADQSHEDAKMIFRWIQTLTQPQFTQSQLTYAWRHKKWSAERSAKALRILQERHLISCPVKYPTRKPTHVYFIHPDLLKTA